MKKPRMRNVENFICHNGDLDFFDVGARTYDLSAIQRWLPRVTGSPMPCSVDSAAIAGLVDLHRAQGCWFLAARYGVLFGVDRGTLSFDVPRDATLQKFAECLDQVFHEALEESEASIDASQEDGAWTASFIRRRKTMSQDDWCAPPAADSSRGLRDRKSVV